MHTPGPWTVDPKTLAVYAPDRHGHAAAVRVAECGRTLLPAAEIRANAALVAVAPDLLAMLQKLVQAVNRLPTSSPLDGLAEDAQSLITRATGGQ